MEADRNSSPVNKSEVLCIPSLVRRLMPNASEQELSEATENLRRFVCIAEEIYLRMKRDGTLPEELKRLEGRGDVGTS